MKKCNFEIEASFGLPFDYENWYETMMVELTDEQFNLIVMPCEDGKKQMSGKTGTLKMVMITLFTEICRIFGSCFRRN